MPPNAKKPPREGRLVLNFIICRIWLRGRATGTVCLRWSAECLEYISPSRAIISMAAATPNEMNRVYLPSNEKPGFKVTVIVASLTIARNPATWVIRHAVRKPRCRGLFM